MLISIFLIFHREKRIFGLLFLEFYYIYILFILLLWPIIIWIIYGIACLAHWSFSFRIIYINIEYIIKEIIGGSRLCPGERESVQTTEASVFFLAYISLDNESHGVTFLFIWHLLVGAYLCSTAHHSVHH